MLPGNRNAKDLRPIFLFLTVAEGEETDDSEEKDRLDHGEQGPCQVWEGSEPAGPFILQSESDPTL